jgi:carbonic anhydrase
MERLIRGYREFRKKGWPAERANYEALAHKGQKPEYLLIACSDSRSDPATIFGAHPGEFFVVRNIAAVVPPYGATDGLFGTRSAIAYAVVALNVRNIVVMGHAQCGGVGAAIDPESAKDIPFVKEWVDLIEPAITRTPENGHGTDGHTHAEREVVKLSLERLADYPFIAERIAAGKLKIDGARFGIADGVLEVLNKETGKFEAVQPKKFWGK